MDTDLTSVNRLTKDLAGAASTLSQDEARFLVDAYYQMQNNRMRAFGQVRAMTESGEPHSVLAWLADNSETLEKQIARSLKKYAESHRLGEWAMSIKGIGPIIAAGLLAYIDISKAPTVGHIWRFAGLDPTQTWEKKQKRPWNASLKVLCWKIGESFVKVSGSEDAFYAQMYVQRKAMEQAKNERGEYKEQAAAALVAKKFRDDTSAKKCYESGILPPGHIHARAKRYAVKLFLAHYHEVGYRELHGTAPPLPYPIAILGHAHKIEVQ